MYSNISITQLKCQHVTACFKTEKHLAFSPSAASKICVLKLRFTVVYLTLTGLQKAKSWSQLNPSGVTLYVDLEPKTHHQTPMTCTYGYSHFRHFQNCCNRDGNTIFKYMNCISISVATVLEVSKMTVSICTSHWCLVMSFWLKVCIYSHTRGVKPNLYFCVGPTP